MTKREWIEALLGLHAGDAARRTPPHVPRPVDGGGCADRRGDMCMTSDLPDIRPTPHGDRVPLSYQQARRWAAERGGTVGFRTGSNGGVVANTYAAFTIVGHIDVAGVQRALDAIVDRHEILRTQIVDHDGTPMQVVGAPRPVPIRVVDVTGVEPAIREAELARASADLVFAPFDFGRDLLARSLVARVSPAEHVLVVTIPHLASDGWSLHVLEHELAALLRDPTRPPPPLPVQFADFVAWQRAWLDGAAQAVIASHYANTIASAEPLVLPARRPANGAGTWDAAEYAFRWAPDVAAGVRALGARYSVTPFVIVHAAYNVLLSAWTGGRDITVLSAFAGRMPTEVLPLIGYFTNLCPVRTVLADDLPFDEVVARTRRSVVDAYAHQWVPLACLEELAAADNKAPLRFAAGINLFSGGAPAQRNARRCVECRPRALALPTEERGRLTRTDISLRITELGPDGVAGVVVYRSAVLDRDVVAECIRHLEAILLAVVSDPSRRVRCLAA